MKPAAAGKNRTSELTAGQRATMACMLEVMIPKPGNVHRSADFADTTLQDFLVSAVAIAPAMDRAPHQPLGQTVLEAVQATRALVKVNTNLGMILLIAPLAAVGNIEGKAVWQLLRASDRDDCRLIYEAIAVASPGGLGSAPHHDVIHGDAPDHILDAMQEAADRDMIARQYVNGFKEVLEFVLPAIEQRQHSGLSLSDAVIRAFLQTMAEFPDSLIARKNGMELAKYCTARAGHVLAAGEAGEQSYLVALEELDFWLRSDGNRRNPGTTADLIAAALFAGLSTGRLSLR